MGMKYEIQKNAEISHKHKKQQWLFFANSSFKRYQETQNDLSLKNYEYCINEVKTLPMWWEIEIAGIQVLDKYTEFKDWQKQDQIRDITKLLRKELAQ